MVKDPFIDLVGIEEAALYARLSIRHMRLLIEKGKIKGKKIGRDWITTIEEIDNYLSTNPRPGPKPKKT